MSEFPIPAGYSWQYQVLLWLQRFHTPWLDKVTHVFSWLGAETFYIIALPILFWSVNKKMGLRLLYVFISSMTVNAWLKDYFEVVRPIGVPGIRSLYVSSAPGYSLPSGHAQGALTFWIGTALWWKRWWLWAAAVVIGLGTGLSRLYLGLHWPLDALVGWGLGLVFGFGGWWLGTWWDYRHYVRSIRLTVVLGIPTFLLWAHTGLASAQYAALLLGVGVGAELEGRWLGLEIEKAVWKRVCAAVIGIAGLIALQWITRNTAQWLTHAEVETWAVPGAAALWRIPAMLKLTGAVSSTGWYVGRDVLLGLWGTLGAPYVFSLCGLYRREARR